MRDKDPLSPFSDVLVINWNFIYPFNFLILSILFFYYALYLKLVVLWTTINDIHVCIILNILGLFKKVIIHSGSPLGFWAMTDPTWSQGYNIDPKKYEKKRKSLTFKDYMKRKKVSEIREMKGMVNTRATSFFDVDVNNILQNGCWWP